MKKLVLLISIFILSQNSYSQNTCMPIQSTFSTCPGVGFSVVSQITPTPPPPNPYLNYDFNITTHSQSFNLNVGGLYSSGALLPVKVYGPFNIVGGDYSSICNGISSGAIIPTIYNPIGNSINIVFSTPGYYILQYSKPISGYSFSFGGPCTQEYQIVQQPPTIVNCENCITSFSPESGKYIVSAWVKENGAPVGTVNYTNSKITVSYNGTTVTSEDVYPSGQIIDGWQRMEGEIEIPVGTTDITITLTNTQNGGISYFDDIRFFPFDGSMMSYVYDPETLRLVAELDERNYAKFYEYDEEGKLIRVKKETERGVMTIQENRNNIKK